MEKDKRILADALKESEMNDTRFLIEQYHVISNNRLQHNDLFWNFQLVFLTAQSFLLMLALGGFVKNPLANAIGALCGFVFGFMSIQAFERNRFMEVCEAEFLLDIEKKQRKEYPCVLIIHDRPQSYRYLNQKSLMVKMKSRDKLNFLNQGSSHDLWKCGMWLIMAINVFLFFYHLFVFGFRDYKGNFLWCDSYYGFRESFDKFALTTLFSILAINWVLFMLHLVLKSQPFRINRDKVNKRIDYAQKARTFRILIYLLQLLLILCATIVSVLAYSHLIEYTPNIWLILFIVCSILSPIPFFYTRSKKQPLHKQKHKC